MKLEFCRNGCDCRLKENGLEQQMQEYLQLGAIPHCFFPELCEKHLVAAENDNFTAGRLCFYLSPAAFYQHHSQDSGHIHISLAQLHAAFSPRTGKVVFALDDGGRLELSSEESEKLFAQAEFAAKRLRPAEVDIEIEEGEQLIFSTPDPMLPPEFMKFLIEQFRGLASAVYAFETTEPGQSGNLVIAVLPENGGESIPDLNLISMQLAQGADLYLEDRSQIDLMLLDANEKEMIEIIASVSPEINLL